MGSFNETCGVSGLPISWKTPTRMFIIRPHWFLDIHYQAEWEPVGIVPLKGTYADCGMLENLDLSPAFQLEHRSILASVQDFSEEARERHWEIFKRYPDDPGALYELCERGVLKVSTCHGVHACAPFYVREDVYQLVLERSRKAKSWRGKSYLERCEEMVATRFEGRVLEDEIFPLHKAEASDEDVARRKELMQRKVRLENLDNGHGRHLGRMLLIEPWNQIQADPSLRSSLEQAMLEFELFAGGLGAVNVAWQPKTARGQDDDYGYHAKWHRELASICVEAGKGGYRR